MATVEKPVVDAKVNFRGTATNALPEGHDTPANRQILNEIQEDTGRLVSSELDY